GNSITAGYGTSSATTKAWPAQLGSMLGSDYSVLNCGITGATMLKKGDNPYWNTTQFTDAKNFDPQIVIISLGLNDAKTLNWVYKSEFQSDYIDMINEFRANGKNPNIYICYPSPYFGNTSQNKIITDEMLGMIQSVSTSEGTSIIDFNSQLAIYSNLFPDGLHPNDLGSGVMAQIVHNSIMQATAISSGKIYKIISKASNKILQVANSSMDNNANVETWVDTQSDAQRWIVTSLDNDLYTLTNVASGEFLHLAASVPSNSVNVNQYSNSNNNTVKWKIVNQGNGYFMLQSAENDDYVLDLAGAGTADGTNVDVYQSDGSSAQLWSFHLETPQDEAPTAAIAEKMFAAWRAKYYERNRTGNEVIAKESFWGVAEMMEIVDDAYEVTGNTKYSSMFSTMYSLFLNKEGSDWMWNDFNDDITWMVIACTRASLLTGNTTFQVKAKEQFDKMYARAIHEGSWLTWKQGTSGTNSCINGPAMVACCYLAQATGDSTYYNKAIAIYNWSKGKLFNPATGKVNDNYNNGTIGDWSSTYNQGTYLGAAMMLYNYTKNPIYFLEAQRIAEFTRVNMWNSKTMNGEDGPDLNGFKGIFMRYARRYVVDGNRTDYIPWLQLNAKVAYNNRNAENLIYTRWGTKATETITLPAATAIGQIPAFAASTAVSLLINCPYSTVLNRNAYNTIESESFDYFKGIRVEPCPDGSSNLGGIRPGFYTAYNNVDFGFKGAASAEIRLSGTSDGNTIEIRLGSQTGTLIGTTNVPNNGDWANYTTVTCPVTNVKGLQKIYLVYQGSGFICNVNSFKFIEAEAALETNGLLGSYFNGTSLVNPVVQRIDSTIDFDWAEFSPAAPINVNLFSARWTGKVQPLYTDTYTFYITSDNGRRVWVNDKQLVNSWTNIVGITFSGV
ncbi:MAG: glycoside hydrolase family 76 protein, partial [Paludibacter sp.]